MTANSLVFQPVNTLFSTDSIKQGVLPLYQLPKRASVSFLQAGVNDTYLITTDSDKYIFRIYRVHLQSYENIQYEMDFLLHLNSQGVSVAGPIKSREGSYIIPIDCPEGQRYAVLFQFAKDRAINYEKDETGFANIYGKSLAKLHMAQKSFSSRFERQKLDLNTLVYQPLKKIGPFFFNHQEKLAIIKDITDFVLEAFTQLPKNALTTGVCHGDTHCGNAHIDSTDLITFFDFDCCGQGWLEYDLATFYWGALSINKKERWKHFLAGYTTINNKYKINNNAIDLLVAMRQLWLLGLHSDTSLLHGKNWYNNSYFEMNTRFFVEWKKRYLEET